MIPPWPPQLTGHGLTSLCGSMDTYDWQMSLCFIFRLSLNTPLLGYIYWYLLTVIPQLSCLEIQCLISPKSSPFPSQASHSRCNTLSSLYICMFSCLIGSNCCLFCQKGRSHSKYQWPLKSYHLSQADVWSKCNIQYCMTLEFLGVTVIVCYD